MWDVLKQIVKNRAKVGMVNFLLEMTIGILTEWQRSNASGNLDFNQKKQAYDEFRNNNNEIRH